MDPAGPKMEERGSQRAGLDYWYSWRRLLVQCTPGAGKATQAAMLAQKYDCVHLATAELLRSRGRDERDERESTRVHGC